MNKTIKVAATLSIAGVLALTGCGGDSDASDGGGTTLNLVGYSVLEQANKGVISAFEDTDAGKDVELQGVLRRLRRPVACRRGRAKADEVHLSLEPDVTRLVDEGLVADDWKDNDTKGICTNSVVVFVVQKGNPKGIESWDDLIQDGVGIVTPNPASSGSAKWNLLAAYGAAKDEGGSDEAAQEYMTKFFGNVAALPDSGRDATTAFTSGTGDVLLSYENEAILARQSGQDFDYVIPDETLLDRERRARSSTDAPKAAAGLPGLPEERRRPEAVRRDRLPPARRRRRPRGRRRQRPERPVPGAGRSCSPSTVTSAAGARPTACTSATARTATRSGSSPRSSPRPGSSRNHVYCDRKCRGGPAGARAPVGLAAQPDQGLRARAGRQHDLCSACWC